MRPAKLLAAAIMIAISNANPPKQQETPDTEAPHIRTYFYIGGEYAKDEKGGHFFRDQMYVEKLVPAQGVTQKFPIIMMHGNCMTGTVGRTMRC